ncbi:hypothetical protein O9G_005818, partial [Rozella allomycis CSF55]
MKHANYLNDRLAELKRSLRCFIQVCTSGESSKNGVRPEDLMALVDHIVNKCKNIELRGLMTIGAADGDP